MSVEAGEGSDVWIRWDWLWSTIFYGSVALSAGLAIAGRGGLSGAGTGPILGLTLLWLGWHALGLRLAHRGLESWQERRWQRFVVVLGDIAFWFVLVGLAESYYFALFGLFGQIFRHLPLRLASVAVLVLIGAMGYRQLVVAGQPFSLADPQLMIFVMAAGASILLGVWVTAIIGQSTRRRELIEQLEATQAQLAAAERREGMLQERQRLAREIHDTLAQGFTSIVMHLEAAEQALPADPETLQKHLNAARDTARHSLEQARRVVADLRPELLEQQPLPEAIGRTSARWSAASGIGVQVTTTGARRPLHPDIEVTLLRAAQEALNNVRKHAGATEVSLTLSYMADVVLLDVQDNGNGIGETPAGLLSGGFGLRAMRERVEQLGGEVLVEREPGEGMTVVVSLPAAAAEAP